MKRKKLLQLVCESKDGKVNKKGLIKTMAFSSSINYADHRTKYKEWLKKNKPNFKIYI